MKEFTKKVSSICIYTEGSQVLELDDGTIAYITLKQPTIKSNSSSTTLPKKQKTFLCPQEGCGRLYTSAHHLKVGLLYDLAYLYGLLTMPTRVIGSLVQ